MLHTCKSKVARPDEGWVYEVELRHSGRLSANDGHESRVYENERKNA